MCIHNETKNKKSSLLMLELKYLFHCVDAIEKNVLCNSILLRDRKKH